MMMASRSMRSSREARGPEKGFYGLADHQNRGKFSSILKRKNRNIQMPDEVKSLCKQVEAYKSCSDNLHQSIMFMIVENVDTAKKLVQEIKTEPNYRYAAQYLKTYESVASTPGKTKYESLEPAIKALTNLDLEHDRRVKKLLDAVKPLTKWIGEDYWEYVKLRAVYTESIASAEDAVAQQNKERSEAAERAATAAQKKKNDNYKKLVDYMKNEIFEQKGKHAESVLKFRDEMIAYHRAMADLIPSNEKPGQKSVRGNRTPK